MLSHLSNNFISDTRYGQIQIRPLQAEQDSTDIHRWVTQAYASFWGMQDYSLQQVKDFYSGLNNKEGFQACMGLLHGKPAFVLECYLPEVEEIASHYSVDKGDMGMHILLAPAEVPLPDFSWQIFSSTMLFLFNSDSIQRIVVEPDIRNHKIHRLNLRAGFKHIKRLQLVHKQALLGLCHRHDFERAMQAEEKSNTQVSLSPHQACQFINAETWQTVTRQLLAKAISEAIHERILMPETLDKNQYQLNTPDGKYRYLFKAEQLALEHWRIDPDSIQVWNAQTKEKPDVMVFISAFHELMGIPVKLLPTYLEEITSTLYGAAFKREKNGLSAKQLIHADFQQIESAMNEGHPSFIANNGRIGFDADDYRRYAPEAGQVTQLIWLAAHQNRCDFSHCSDLDINSHFQQELDLSVRLAFEKQLQDLGLQPADYIWFPVHPWQWFNKLANVYAHDIAEQFLVCLGYAGDKYQPQQSIRTFYNVNHPSRYYVKTALSVLNMGFMRGLSAKYMASTPAINDWLEHTLANDKTLEQANFHILKELAAVGYRNPHYENEALADNPYKKMLAALWRETPWSKLTAGQTPMTMAALLHIDPQGQSLLAELVQASDLTTREWLHCYFQAYLTPVLHCYFAHDIVYMPHGENVILIMQEFTPRGALMKDLGEEIYLINNDQALPENVSRIALNMPVDIAVLSIFTDVFDGFFRYLSTILQQYLDFPEQEFWAAVAEHIYTYQDSQPHLQQKFQQHNLFRETFAHSCLNRLQLKNNQQMVDLSDPANSLQFIGELKNPIAPFLRSNADDTVKEKASA